MVSWSKVFSMLTPNLRWNFATPCTGFVPSFSNFCPRAFVTLYTYRNCSKIAWKCPLLFIFLRPLESVCLKWLWYIKQTQLRSLGTIKGKTLQIWTVCVLLTSRYDRKVEFYKWLHPGSYKIGPLEYLQMKQLPIPIFSSSAWKVSFEIFSTLKSFFPFDLTNLASNLDESSKTFVLRKGLTRCCSFYPVDSV